MPELETVNLRGIEIFAVGKWNGREYTGEDLDAMVTAFHDLKGVIDPPAKLGHNEGQTLIQADGFPAVGWIEDLRRDGDTLVADFSRVPKKIGALINAGAYRNVSSEVWFDVEADGKKYARVLAGVAFLGDQIPAVGDLKKLDDVAALYAKRDRGAFGTRVVAITHTFAKEGHMTQKDEEAALVGQLERLGKSTGLASFARATLARFGAWRRRDHVDDSYETKRQAIQSALDEKYAGLEGYGPWIVATYDDRVIAQKADAYYAVPYTMADDGSLTLGEATEVEQTWTPKAAPAPAPAPAPEPSPAPSDNPVTNALKRKETDQMKAIAHALGLKDDASETEIVAAIGERPTTEQFTKLTTEVTELKEHNLQADAGAAVDAAIRAKKVAPASRDTMLPFARTDPKGFAAFVEKAPAIFTGASGSDADAPAAKSAADEINGKVVEILKADTTGKLTFAKALESVSRANPDLARKYVEERGASARLS